MSLNTIPQRIELVMWMTSTHLMKTSTLVARSVVLGHDFYHWLITHRTNSKILLLALAGLCFGFVSGLLYLGIR